MRVAKVGQVALGTCRAVRSPRSVLPGAAAELRFLQRLRLGREFVPLPSAGRVLLLEAKKGCW